jgi:hypothetical protein
VVKFKRDIIESCLENKKPINLLVKCIEDETLSDLGYLEDINLEDFKPYRAYVYLPEEIDKFLRKHYAKDAANISGMIILKKDHRNYLHSKICTHINGDNFDNKKAHSIKELEQKSNPLYMGTML